MTACWRTPTLFEARPQSIFSWDYAIQDQGRIISQLDLSVFRERATFSIQGQDFEIHRQGLMAGSFLLTQHGQTIVDAQKPSFLTRRFVVNIGNTTYDFRVPSIFSRSMVLYDQRRHVGTISRAGLFSRRAIVDLPNEIDPPVQIFLLFLTVILWKRQSRSS